MDQTNLCKTTYIEEASFSTRSGEKYWILHQTRIHTYLRLDEQDYFLWNLMDGKRTITDLVIDFQNTYKSMPFSRLDRLIMSLSENGFFQANVIQNSDYHPEIQKYFNINCFWEILFPIRNIDGLFFRLFQSTAWMIRLLWARTVFWLICLAGLVYFIITEPLPSYPILLEGDSHIIGIIWTYVAILASAILHECGHALMCKYYGRNINNAGLVLYYGSPCLFVDTSDIWMTPREARIVVSLAGPAVNFFIGSLCSLTVLLFPDTAYSTGIWRFALVSYCICIINLNPLLEFDGYYALTDLLEIPNLRRQAFQYIRSFSLIKIMRKEEQVNTRDIIYILYGVGGGLFTIIMVLIGMYIWEEHVTDLVEDIITNTYERDHFFTSLVIILIFLPFIVGMIVQGFSYLRLHLNRSHQPVQEK